MFLRLWEATPRKTLPHQAWIKIGLGPKHCTTVGTFVSHNFVTEQ